MSNLQELYDFYLETNPSTGKIRNATNFLIHACQAMEVSSPEEIDDDLIEELPSAIDQYFGDNQQKAVHDKGVLAEMIEAHDDPGTAFAAYTEARRRHADALADLALANFDEMRDLVRSPLFVMEKNLGKLAHRLLGRAFLPLYTMVTFSRIPYADAVARARRQERLARWAVAAGAVLLLAAAGWSLLGSS